MIQRARAWLSRELARTLGTLASLSPRVGFFACDLLAKLWALTSRRPIRASVRSFFPELSTHEVDRVYRRFWSNHARTLLLGGWFRRERLAVLRRLVHENEALRTLRAPMILGTFHVGPTVGLGVVPERVQDEVLVLRGTQFPLDRNKAARGNVKIVQGTDQQRAATFHQAIERLRANGFILMALDPGEAQRIAVPFFGRTLQLARGPFAMARVARVPIVPIVAKWDGDAIELIVGDPLPLIQDERSLATAAAQWLERYLRQNPGELSYRVFELLD